LTSSRVTCLSWKNSDVGVVSLKHHSLRGVLLVPGLRTILGEHRSGLDPVKESRVRWIPWKQLPEQSIKNIQEGDSLVQVTPGVGKVILPVVDAVET